MTPIELTEQEEQEVALLTERLTELSQLAFGFQQKIAALQGAAEETKQLFVMMHERYMHLTGEGFDIVSAIAVIDEDKGDDNDESETDLP